MYSFFLKKISVLQNDYAAFPLVLIMFNVFSRWLIAEPIVAMFHILLKNYM